MLKDLIIKEWLEYAISDLKNAGILCKNRSYKDSIWYCHQAIEKLLKAILIHQGKEAMRVHDLVRLWEEANPTRSESISMFLEELNPYYILSRYPEVGFKMKVIYKKKDAVRILKTAKEVFKWLRLQLRH